MPLTPPLQPPKKALDVKNYFSDMPQDRNLKFIFCKTHSQYWIENALEVAKVKISGRRLKIPPVSEWWFGCFRLISAFHLAF
jgi:hypothetical protein